MNFELVNAYVCLLYVLIVLMCGLWPFNFRSANGMAWLKAEQGIYFHDLGIVYGPAKLNNSDQPILLGKNESISIELWLTPGEDNRRGFSYILCLYDDQQPELFSLSQVKNLLNISKYQTPGKKGLTHNWRWLKNAFPKGQRRFLTITSDKYKTTVYLEGKKAREYRNYSLAPAKELTPAWRMVIGNDPTGKKPWTGKIHGLALYNHSLSPKKIIKHFEKWRNKSALSLIRERDIIALYPMDEQKGQIIHNAVFNHYHLSIPDRFKILKKNFLKLYGGNLKLNDTNLKDMCINILGFIPLGYFLFLVFNLYSQPLKTSVWRPILLAIICGTAISLMVEILQAYLPTRNSSLSDLIFNTFGTGLGIILALIFIRLKTRSRRTLFTES